jgi:hypothetical protein
VTRHIDGIKRHAPGVDGKASGKVPPDMACRPHQDRCPALAKVALAVTDQILLQLPRLDQVTVKRIVKFLKFRQCRSDQAVLFHQFGLHAQDTLASPQPGAQFIRADGFGQKVIGPCLQPAGDFGLFGF